MNRGIARRTLFENDRDIRTFLARLALRVRAGQLEIHAFCILTTHYHLLVRSPVGQIAEAIGEVQGDYSRWFNRTRKRDGPLFRGRFASKPVEDDRYRHQLVRYIDFNPVAAGLVATPGLYPHGSARFYAEQRGPAWLERSFVEAAVRRPDRVATYDPREYARTFGEPVSDRLARLIEKRLALTEIGADPLADLLDAANDRVLAWMRERAALADGMPVGVPVCDPEDVCTELARARALYGAWHVNPNRKRANAWNQIEIALLRDLCGLKWNVVAARTNASAITARRRYEHHDQCLRTDASYSARAAELAAACVRHCHGPRGAEIETTSIHDGPARARGLNV